MNTLNISLVLPVIWGNHENGAALPMHFHQLWSANMGIPPSVPASDKETMEHRWEETAPAPVKPHYPPFRYVPLSISFLFQGSCLLQAAALACCIEGLACVVFPAISNSQSRHPDYLLLDWTGSMWPTWSYCLPCLNSTRRGLHVHCRGWVSAVSPGLCFKSSLGPEDHDHNMFCIHTSGA